jgi:Zn-dependent protease/predicted transcriptional regulator
MRGMRIGRLFGFEIRIDSSWFILFALILWTFSYIAFPQQVPGLSTAAYIAMGATGTLLFFVSLLLHEIAHSLVARAKGIPVDGITLFLFGGMAHTRREAETPGDEFLIAGAGPVMSIAIALALFTLMGVGAALAWPPAVLAVLQYIAALNVILAVFNLLPGFPLDGGRLFRAIVWKVTGDMHRATRVASVGGRWLAYLLMAFGLLSAFAGNVLGGMWLVFIGWFLRNAAVSTYRQHMLLSLLSGVRAAQVMTPDPDTVPADATVRELTDTYFVRRHYAAYPVVDNGQTVGIVTLQSARDVPQDEWDMHRAADIMVAADENVVARPEEDMVAVLDRLRGSPARRVLVMRDGHLLGIITGSDVTAWLERARQEKDG